MTDRISALFVVLEREIREDDIEPLIAAISQLRGVAKVKKHVKDPGEYVAQTLARIEIQKKLWNALKEPGEPLWE